MLGALTPLGTVPLGTLHPLGVRKGDVRSSVYAALKGILDDVSCWPDALDESTPFPAVMFSFQGLVPQYVMPDSILEGRRLVGWTGQLHVHSFDYSKPESVRRAREAVAALVGLRGPLGSVTVTSSFKAVDVTDMEAPAPDGSGRTLYDTAAIFALGWRE